jgi:transglutaminase-like putative cysteine protease
MLIRLGYDIGFNIPAPVTIVAMLHVHPSREPDLLEPDELKLDPNVPITSYIDTFGNRCSRFVAPTGHIRLTGSTLIEDSGLEDPSPLDAAEHPVADLPNETLIYLLNSRYCEVDRLCDWVYSKVAFGYQHARSTKTALDVFTERVGVCRDFQHLAVTFCRALNIPARYVTGYLGDIGIPPTYTPMDFSAWFEVYLANRWWTVDARHNHPRIGRVLMAVGRDASDVAITTSFGIASLTHFNVVSDEVATETASGFRK